MATRLSSLVLPRLASCCSPSRTPASAAYSASRAIWTLDDIARSPVTVMTNAATSTEIRSSSSTTVSSAAPCSRRSFDPGFGRFIGTFLLEAAGPDRGPRRIQHRVLLGARGRRAQHRVELLDQRQVVRIARRGAVLEQVRHGELGDVVGHDLRRLILLPAHQLGAL